MLDELSLVQKAAVVALPVLFAITLHEAAHGYVARYFGDMTAYAAGRISLNPLRHIDPVGTILVPLISLFAAQVLFGWAKPVPVNFANLRNPKKDMLWVALAGPMSNMLMAFMWAVVFKIGAGPAAGTAAEAWLMLIGACGIFVNLVFTLLNLLPLPPLDGGRVAVSLLPHAWAWRLARTERFGFIILIALLASGVLNTILSPLLHAAVIAIGALFNIAPIQLFQLISLI